MFSRRYTCVFALLSAAAQTKQSVSPANIQLRGSCAMESAVSVSLTPEQAWDQGQRANRRKDHPKAKCLFLVASDKGHPQAPGAIGAMYYAGITVKRDLAEAFQWYSTGANRGNPAAQLQVGDMLDVGEGVAQNHEEAVRFWNLAAAQGYAAARERLK